MTLVIFGHTSWRSRKRACSVLGAACMTMLVSSSNAATLVRGQLRTCHDFADLDAALDHPNSLYFKGWTSADFDAAQSWITSCVTTSPTDLEKARDSQLAQRRQRLDSSGEIQRNELAIKSHREEELREEADKERELKAAEAERQTDEARRRAADARKTAAEQISRSAHEACLRSTAYLRFVAQTHVVEALSRESAAQAMLQHERRVEQLSETENLTARRQAGESIVAAQDDLAKWWAAYVRSGGAAGTPQAVSGPLSNPCE